MKVLHVLYSNCFSGAENVVCQIISMMRDEDNIVMYYCSRDGSIRQALDERNISFFPVKDLTVKELKSVIKKCNPDIIHAHDMRASFIAALSCGNIPVISHIHINALASRKISLKAVGYLYAAQKAKHIFWVSDSSLKGYLFREFFVTKSSVLYNVLDIQALYKRMNLDNNTYDYDVIYVGRLSYQKNPGRLMKVCHLLSEKKPDIKIAIVGSGELEKKTKQRACELGLENNVSFLGFQNNPLKMIYDSKVMIMTSIFEGTPMCALEALSLGVPVVSTPVDGLNNIIISGKNGFTEENDEKICERILSIIEDDSIRNKMKEHAKELAIEYNDLKAYKDKILIQYEKCKR